MIRDSHAIAGTVVRINQTVSFSVPLHTVVRGQSETESSIFQSFIFTFGASIPPEPHPLCISIISIRLIAPLDGIAAGAAAVDSCAASIGAGRLRFPSR